MNAIEDMELGALAEFGSLKKRVDRREWLALTPKWVGWPAPKGEGCQKFDGHGIGARPSFRGCGQEAVFNNRVNPQLQVTERLGEMTAAACS